MYQYSVSVYLIKRREPAETRSLQVSLQVGEICNSTEHQRSVGILVVSDY